MTRFGNALVQLEQHAGTFSAEALATVLDPAWIEEALVATGKASRRVRALPADLVVWLCIGMGLFRGMGIRNVLFRLSVGLRRRLRWNRGEPPPSNAITKARDRLGLEPLLHVFGRLVNALNVKHAAQHLWRGLRVVAIDGTSFKTPDSPKNRAYFGAPGASRGRSAYPQMRAVALMAAFTHIVLAVSFGAWSVSENRLALELISHLGRGSVVLLDRGFQSAWLLWQILAQGSHFVVRAKKKVRLRWIRSLGPGEYLADLLVPRYLRRLRPELPQVICVRVIRYRVPGFQRVRLITSLLDPGAFPAAEIVERYRDRWEIELGYDEIKTHLTGAPVVFRSQTPERVLQEAFGLMIAYNIVRSLMATAAAQTGCDPRRLSFVDALERVFLALTQMALAPGRQLPHLFDKLLKSLAACTMPPRRARRYPRAVKVKMSSYPLNRRQHAA